MSIGHLLRVALPGSVIAAIAVCVSSFPAAAADSQASRSGYYRFPATHGDTVVFTTEGDLWSVSIHGGVPRRLTSNPGMESHASISPDGQSIAFLGQYEGPNEVYTIPLGGGVPQRRTWDGESSPVGWAADGRLLIRTLRYSTLPDPKLVLLDNHGGHEVLPLAEGAEAAYSADGGSLFFTRYLKQGSMTKRYQGGAAENIWRFDGTGEAVALTADWNGTSHGPMVSNGRVYFLSDRDGVMNVFSMDMQGHDVKQESHQKTLDIESASISDGRIVYACAADLWSLDLKSGHEEIIPITLVSDFDQLRDHWVKKPSAFLTSVHVAPDGGSAVFTARGEVFTVPAKSGRIVKVAGNSAVRYREARYMPDGKSIVALSTESGETEFWKFPANGAGSAEQWTRNAKVLRWDGVVSPDGHWLAHHDKDQQLWIFDIKTKQDKRIARSNTGPFDDLKWSPDSRWLAFVQAAANTFEQINVYDVQNAAIQPITSDRYNSASPSWSADGKWLYFLSDRSLNTTVQGPWGARQPEPHFDRAVQIFQLALQPNLRSPFLAPDELHPDANSGKDDKASEPTAASKAGKSAEAKKLPPKPETQIDFADLNSRLSEVPAPPGNYGNLQATDKRLCWQDASDEPKPKLALKCLDIANKGDEVETLTGDIKTFELSADRKKLLIVKENDQLIVDADIKPAGFGDSKAIGRATLNLSRWTFFTNPRTEFHSIYLDAWRLERDYFYDKKMHGVDWNAMRTRYLPLVDRVSDRAELNDVIGQLVSELSALHTFVVGGDSRRPADQIDLAAFGAVLHRDDKAGGFVVDHIYRTDPDLPGKAAPFARPESRVKEGEVIVSIDGENLTNTADERALLRGKAGSEVLLRVKSSAHEPRDVLVTPIKASEEATLRYAEWEYMRRVKVDSDSGNQIGYVHLRAMGNEDIDQWAREFYPIFNRAGLIIDVRHNGGGNIDSWLLSKLIRQAWFYWQPRVGQPEWNMQYAFRGHMVVLCDQGTASDGEAFTEGFRRFHLGKVIGTRTWGGEIWLSFSNFESDGGIASAAELGVYGPEGKWLIEGHGVDPDIMVDDLPHATYKGEDAQLNAAVSLLKEEIRKDPRPVPPMPPYPDKSFPYKN
jgi:tricorn protease